MLSLLKKLVILLGGVGLSILYFFSKKNRDNPTSPLENIADELKSDIKDIEKQEKKLEIDGVDKLTDEEEVKYWK